MAFHNLVRSAAAGISLLLVAAAPGDKKPRQNVLTQKEIEDGWVLLFDGETTFGWELFTVGQGKPEVAMKDDRGVSPLDAATGRAGIKDNRPSPAVAKILQTALGQ